MFERLKKKADKFIKLDQNKLMDEVLKEPEIDFLIVDLNQYQLFNEGIQADGNETGQYAYNTIHGTREYLGKIDKGQPYDHITLKDTGAFYDSMMVKSVPDGIVIDANDPNYLQGRFPKMLGLTKKSISEIIPDIKKSLLKRIHEEIA